MKKQLLFWSADFLGWLGHALDTASMFCTEAGWHTAQAAFKSNPRGWRDGISR